MVESFAWLEDGVEITVMDGGANVHVIRFRNPGDVIPMLKVFGSKEIVEKLHFELTAYLQESDLSRSEGAVTGESGEKGSEVG